MLLDDWMPEHDVAARYATVVAAPPARVFAALRGADLGRHPVVRALMGLRALPALLSRRTHERQPARASSGLPGAFVVLAEDPPREVVWGISGRFWRLTGNVAPTDPARFRDPPPAGTARAAWNFLVRPLDAGHSELATETRVRCADARSRRSFLRYWRIVGPASGLIRRLILRDIRRAAERGPAPAVGRTR